MSKFLMILPLALVVRVHAEPVPSFEASLDAVRAEVDAARAEQVRAKSKDLSERIRKTGEAVNKMVNEINDLPNFIFDLRQRSGNPRDPHLRADVNNLAVRMRFLRERVAVFLVTTQEFRRLAGKDLDLIQPAMDLFRVSHNLASKIDLVEGEMRKTQAPLDHAGFGQEARAIAQDNRLLSEAALRLSFEASELYKQIVSK